MQLSSARHTRKAAGAASGFGAKPQGKHLVSRPAAKRRVRGFKPRASRTGLLGRDTSDGEGTAPRRTDCTLPWRRLLVSRVIHRMPWLHLRRRKAWVLIAFTKVTTMSTRKAVATGRLSMTVIATICTTV